MTAYLPSSPGKHIILSLCMILPALAKWYLLQQICNTNLKVTVNRNCNFIIEGVLGGILGTFK